MQTFSVKCRSVKQLLSDAHAGQFAVPKLQRRFVWDGKRAAQLLDSIDRGMPVGSLMVWRTKRCNEHLLRKHSGILPDCRVDRDVWWIIDGQQRLSSIYGAYRGTKHTNDKGTDVDFGKVVYCYSHKGSGEADEALPSRFAYRSPQRGRDETFRNIVGDGRSGAWRGLTAKRRGTFKKIRDRFLSYRFPVVFVDARELDEVRETFVRINQKGMVVGTADRLFARASKMELREKAEDLRDQFPQGFRRLDLMFLLQAFAFLEMPDGRYVGTKAVEAWIARQEKLVARKTGELGTFAKKWDRFRDAVLRGLKYLADEFGIRGQALLPSGFMLSALVVFFHRLNQSRPNAKQARCIRRWFWFTALGARYSGAGLKPFIDDCKEFIRLASSRDARFKLARIDPRRISDTTYGKRDSSIFRAFLCLLESQRPRDMETGVGIPVSEFGAVPDRKHLHHVFARHSLKTLGVAPAAYNSICNICLLAARQNKSFGSKKPHKYLESLRGKKALAKVLGSHLIEHRAHAAVWNSDTKGAYRAFRSERLRLLCRAFARTAGVKHGEMFVKEP